MAPVNPNQHLSQKFDEEMGNLRNEVMKMDGLVDQQIQRAVNALSSVDIDEAQAVVRNDHYLSIKEAQIGVVT